MLAISQQIPFVEQQRAATVAAELAEQQPQAGQAKRQQETPPQDSSQEPPKLRRVVNLVIQQLAEHRRIDFETALARDQQAQSAKQVAMQRAKMHWAAQAEEQLLAVQQHARARALQVEDCLSNVSDVSKAEALRKAEKKRAKKERQKTKRAAVWALSGRLSNSCTLRRKRGILYGAFVRVWRALSRNGPGPVVSRPRQAERFGHRCTAALAFLALCIFRGATSAGAGQPFLPQTFPPPPPFFKNGEATWGGHFSARQPHSPITSKVV
jgi:hypothetical protein